MNKERVVELLQEALAKITEPRLFETERGYQGELLSALKARLPEAGFDGDPIVEQEYQKRMIPHGVRIRPDLIIHIPFDRGATERRDEGNFVAIEIKRDKRDVQAAFENLVKLKERLGYSLTIFVIINSTLTYAYMCPESIAAQTVCFAVVLENGHTVVKREEPFSRK